MAALAAISSPDQPVRLPCAGFDIAAHLSRVLSRPLWTVLIKGSGPVPSTRRYAANRYRFSNGPSGPPSCWRCLELHEVWAPFGLGLKAMECREFSGRGIDIDSDECPSTHSSGYRTPILLLMASIISITSTEAAWLIRGLSMRPSATRRSSSCASHCMPLPATRAPN